MNREGETYFRNYFEEQISQHAQVQMNLKEILNDMSEIPADHLDMATAFTTNAVRFKLSMRDAQAIQKARAALRKLDLGTFGICENCDEEIGLSRLRVTPTAPFCLDCQAHEENEQKSEARVSAAFRK